MSVPTVAEREATVREISELADHVSVEVLRGVLLPAWRQSGEATLGTERWLTLFRRVGYVIETSPAPRPTEPVRLWRAGHRARGMAWTSRRSMAEQYATNGERRAAEPLWTTLAPSEALLAYSVAEAEHVVDPALLGTIEAVR
ncbi:hypothetical protein [Quadrisphaera setariae]|uniref:Uncharacterized protein n=1 Tax=Quadrisphaera setariae TaxID=2593304 RepID=A0A5C8ZHT2_9ACTN|nr:hypothetical protein [Quadrisphaera setariae]TXR56476.1 hypothetical protein FMM08_10335 [Quadrisphaera setariae]